MNLYIERIDEITEAAGALGRQYAHYASKGTRVADAPGCAAVADDLAKAQRHQERALARARAMERKAAA